MPNHRILMRLHQFKARPEYGLSVDSLVILNHFNGMEEVIGSIPIRSTT